MKRAKPAMRRDRKTGNKSYAGKKPVRYSEVYYNWLHSVTSGIVRREAQEKSRHEGERRKVST